MNTPNEILQAHTANTQTLVAQAGALWVTAGDKSDSAEGLGIDGRINLVHSLIDLGIEELRRLPREPAQGGWRHQAPG